MLLIKHGTSNWKAWLGLGLVVVVMLCDACASPPIPASEIRIGLIAPLSGELAEVGRLGLDTADMFVAHINAAGGVEVGNQRYQLVLVVEDNAENTELTVSAARKLINQENVVAIVGPYTSSAGIVVADIADTARIPIISPWATNPAVTAGKTYMFRVGFTDELQGQVIARFARQELVAQTAAVLYNIASAYNRGLATFFQQEFEKQGGQVVAFEHYTTDEQDFRPQLTRIHDRHPDILFLPNYHYEIPLQVRQIREQQIDATLLGSDTWLFIEPDQRVDLNGTFFTAHYAYDHTQPQQTAFVTAYQERYGRLPLDIDALTYDAFDLLVTAMQREGSIDPEAIRASLSTLQAYTGITGRITYAGTGDPHKSVFMMQFQDGAAVLHGAVDPE